MARIPSLLLLTLAGCAAPDPPAEGPAAPPPAEPAVVRPAPPPPAEPAPAAPEPAAEAPRAEEPLPPVFPVGPTVVTTHRSDGKPSVTVSSRGGSLVPWTESEVRLEPAPFDPLAAGARPGFVDVWEARDDAPRSMRVCMTVSGLPPDALFLELVPKDSEVAWPDGSTGTVREVHAQRPRVLGMPQLGWDLDVLVTLPAKAEAAIDRLRVVALLHRATRVRRSEASLGVGDAAAFDFGVTTSRWVLPEDRELREFRVSRYRKPLLALFERGLQPEFLVRLVDAAGNPLRYGGGSGAGSTSVLEYLGAGADGAAPPVRVTVDIPEETETARVVLRLEGLRPGR